MSARDVKIANKLYEAVEDAKVLSRLEFVLMQALSDLEAVVLGNDVQVLKEAKG